MAVNCKKSDKFLLNKQSNNEKQTSNFKFFPLKTKFTLKLKGTKMKSTSQEKEII
jgi:hypothetical protein